MELISEVENILSGKLKIEADKLKAIAVSESTIKSDENGVVPLSKQSAMKIEKKVPSKLPENEFIETLEDEPIEVASLETLDSFDFSHDDDEKEEKKEEIVKKEEPKEEVEEEPLDMALPEMNDAVIPEPDEMSDDLFVGSDEEKEQEVKEKIISPIRNSESDEENKVVLSSNDYKVSEALIKDLNKEINELQNNLNELLDNYKDNLNKKLENLNSVNEIKEEKKISKEIDNTDTELKVPSLESSNDIPSSLMEEATDQINNIKIPTNEEEEESLPEVDDTKIKGMFI